MTFVFYVLTRIDYSDGTARTLVYDNRGNCISKTDRTGALWEYTYNGRGQVLSAANPLGGVLTYTYDAMGRRASKTDSDTGVVTYVYDDQNQTYQTNYPDGSNRQVFKDKNGNIMARAIGPRDWSSRQAHTLFQHLVGI